MTKLQWDSMTDFAKKVLRSMGAVPLRDLERAERANREILDGWNTFLKERHAETTRSLCRIVPLEAYHLQSIAVKPLTDRDRATLEVEISATRWRTRIEMIGNGPRILALPQWEFQLRQEIYVALRAHIDLRLSSILKQLKDKGFVKIIDLT